MSNLNFPKNLRKTKPRLLVLELMKKEDRALGAQEIANLLTAQKTPVWLSTIYRVLDDFIGTQVVRKIEYVHCDTAMYELCSGNHCHYALCTQCHQKTLLEDCPLQALEHALLQQGFRVEEHEIQMYGVCAECQNKRR